eukprot:TRINITY_DN910_c2_g1_i3.p1 TRINITY_DN910_c2_g1~~TRINITY_DN910_c2_g1_i3.p1  ORF type:complete len:2962 (-),score=808.64 TRINITY_DN910_c2_g1_i3:90-8975(-)
MGDQEESTQPPVEESQSTSQKSGKKKKTLIHIDQMFEDSKFWSTPKSKRDRLGRSESFKSQRVKKAQPVKTSKWQRIVEEELNYLAGDYVAIRFDSGDDDDDGFKLCRLDIDHDKDSTELEISWLDKLSPNKYIISLKEKIDPSTVICGVRMIARRKPGTKVKPENVDEKGSASDSSESDDDSEELEDDQVLLTLPNSERSNIIRILKEDKEEEKNYSDAESVQDSDKESGGEDYDEEEEKPKRKRKSSTSTTTTKRRKVVAKRSGEKKTPKKERKPRAPSTKGRKRKAPDSGTSEPPKKRRKSKVVGVANKNIKVIEQDPTFWSDSGDILEEKDQLCAARNLIRAVLTNNIELIKKLLESPDIFNLYVHRSLDIHMSAIDYAIKYNKLEALKLLLNGPTNPVQRKPSISIQVASGDTGKYNKRTFTHAVRSINISRGGKQGNTAFFKDCEDGSYQYGFELRNSAYYLAKEGSVTKECVQLLYTSWRENFYDFSSQSIALACLFGNRKLAGWLLDKTGGGAGSNHLHKQALLYETKEFDEFKSVSVKKKLNDNLRISPLHMACINPNPKYLAALLDAMPDFALPDAANHKLVHYAAACVSTEPLKLLFERGGMSIQFKEGNLFGTTPLMIAARAGRVENIKFLFDKEVEEKEFQKQLQEKKEKEAKEKLEKEEEGHAEEKEEDESEMQVESAGSTGSKDNNNKEAIVVNSDEECASIKQEKKQDDSDNENEDEDEEGGGRKKGRRKSSVKPKKAAQTLLNTPMVDILDTNKKNKNVPDFISGQGWSALHYAAAEGHTDVIRVLIDHDATVDKPARTTKLTPLHIASQQGHLESVKVLVKNKANLEKQDNQKRTPLILATINGHLNVASYLVHMGADVNALDSSSNSVLHYAAAYGWVEICKFLVENGANVNATNDWTTTPLSIALVKYHTSCIDYLLSLDDTDVNIRDEAGMTIISKALSTLNPSGADHIKYLLEKKKANLSIQDNEGYCSIHHLVSSCPSNETNIVPKSLHEYLMTFVPQQQQPTSFSSYGSNYNRYNNRYQEIKFNEEPDFSLHLSMLDLLVQYGANVNERVQVPGATTTDGSSSTTSKPKTKKKKVKKTKKKYDSSDSGGSGSDEDDGDDDDDGMEVTSTTSTNDAGANNKEEEKGSTPLQLALDSDSFAIAEKLIKLGADVKLLPYNVVEKLLVKFFKYPRRVLSILDSLRDTKALDLKQELSYVKPDGFNRILSVFHQLTQISTSVPEPYNYHVGNKSNQESQDIRRSFASNIVSYHIQLFQELLDYSDKSLLLESVGKLEKYRNLVVPESMDVVDNQDVDKFIEPIGFIGATNILTKPQECVPIEKLQNGHHMYSFRGASPSLFSTTDAVHNLLSALSKPEVIKTPPQSPSKPSETSESRPLEKEPTSSKSSAASTTSTTTTESKKPPVLKHSKLVTYEFSNGSTLTVGHTVPLFILDKGFVYYNLHELKKATVVVNNNKKAKTVKPMIPEVGDVVLVFNPASSHPQLPDPAEWNTLVPHGRTKHFYYPSTDGKLDEAKITKITVTDDEYLIANDVKLYNFYSPQNFFANGILVGKPKSLGWKPEVKAATTDPNAVPESQQYGPLGKSTIIHMISSLASPSLRSLLFNYIKSLFSSAQLSTEFVDKTNINGATALELIMNNSDDEAINFAQNLISLGAKVNIPRVPPSKQPLFVSISNRKWKFACFLIDAGADIELVNQNGNTPLLEAVQIKEDTSLFDKLISKGANLNAKNRSNENILHLITKNDTPYLHRLAGKNLSAIINAADNSKFTALHLACKLYKHNVAESLIKIGADVNALAEQDKTPLQCAIIANKSTSFELEKYLISKKANVNARNSYGRTALLYAVNNVSSGINSSFELLDILIKAGADPKVKDNDGRNLIHYTIKKIKDTNARTDPIDALEYTLSLLKDEHFDEPDNEGKSPLHYAAKSGSTICILHLLQKKAKLDRLDNEQNTPLGLAIFSGHSDNAIHFMQQGADVTRPIFIVKQTNYSVIRNSSLDIKADKYQSVQKISTIRHVLQQDWQGVSFLLLNGNKLPRRLILEDALFNNKFHLTKTIIQKATPQELLQLNDSGENLFHILTKLKHKSFTDNWDLSLANMLSDAQVPLNVPDKEGNLPIINAAKNNHLRLVKFFLHKGVPITTKDSESGHSVLICAIKANYSNVVQTISDLNYFKPDLNEPFVLKKHPQTLIQHAVRNQNIDLVKLLLRNNVKINIQNHQGYTPLFKSLFLGEQNITTLLLENRADPSITDNQGLSPLVYLVKKDLNEVNNYHLKSTEFLRYGADPNVLDPETGYTPLILAIRRNDTNYITNFIKCSKKAINYNFQDKDGKTVIHHVVCPLDFGSYENVALLEMLSLAGADVNILDNQKNSPIYYALMQDSGVMAESLKKLGAKLPPAKPSRESSVVSSDSWPKPDFNLLEDFENGMKAIGEACEVEVVPEVDPNCTHDNVSIVDDNGLLFDIYMTKVDVKYGNSGLNMFYAMQVLHEYSKNVYILFTRWGRVGDVGQFQHTPFRSKDEAISEFKKIFKSKSGNVFAKGMKFKKVGKKYTLREQKKTKRDFSKMTVLTWDTEKLVKMAKENPDDKIDTTIAASTFPKSVVDSMKQIADPESIQSALRLNGINSADLPISQLKRSVLDDSIKLLEDAKSKLNQIEEETNKQPSDIDFKLIEQYYDELTELSNNFYEKLPMSSHSHSKISLLTKNDIDRYLGVIYSLDDVCSARKIIVAANYRRKEINPYDYCLKSLNIKLDILDPLSGEFKALKLYAEKTCGNVYVKNIYKIQRYQEAERIQQFKSLDNQLLLWHGSPSYNFLGILSEGLRIAPPSAPKSGYAFGKGIYFADMLAKSITYCRAGSGTSKFVLLSQVALGKMKELLQTEYMEQAPEGFNSCKAIGKQCPDFTRSIVFPNGVRVPTGDTIQQPKGLFGYNEYIVYNPSQVRMRYLMELK